MRSNQHFSLHKKKHYSKSQLSNNKSLEEEEEKSNFTLLPFLPLIIGHKCVILGPDSTQCERPTCYLRCLPEYQRRCRQPRWIDEKVPQHRRGNRAKPKTKKKERNFSGSLNLNKKNKWIVATCKRTPEPFVCPPNICFSKKNETGRMAAYPRSVRPEATRKPTAGEN